MEKPKDIKITKEQRNLFESLADREVAIKSQLDELGKDKRLLWDGLKAEYGNDEWDNWQWVYNRIEGVLRPATFIPEYQRERFK